MYYNPNTKDILSLTELRKLLNASIPRGTETVGDWYLIHDAKQPEYDPATQRLVPGPIEKQGDIYVRTWVVEPLPEDEIKARRRDEILAELSNLDSRSERCVRAVSKALAHGLSPNMDDVTMVDSYETQAEALRAELRTLQG